MRFRLPKQEIVGAGIGLTTTMAGYHILSHQAVNGQPEGQPDHFSMAHHSQLALGFGTLGAIVGAATYRLTGRNTGRTVASVVATGIAGWLIMSVYHQGGNMDMDEEE